MKAFYLYCLLIIISLIGNNTLASQIKGKVIDERNKPLPFANIYIKGTTIGTISNSEGDYELDLKDGEYDLVFKYIGYKMHTEHISLNNKTFILNIKLKKESINLDEVIISANAEDPAYRVIRNAIKKRKDYLKEVEAYTCDVYMKGIVKINEFPEKILGREIKIKIEDVGILDTLSNIVYLSESVSKFHYKQTDNIKEEMIFFQR